VKTETREQLLALLREGEVRENERLDAAGVPWCVIAEDPVYDYSACWGPYPDPVQACADAERMRRELQEEFAQGEWKVRVARLSPPENIGGVEARENF